MLRIDLNLEILVLNWQSISPANDEVASYWILVEIQGDIVDLVLYDSRDIELPRSDSSRKADTQPSLELAIACA